MDGILDSRESVAQFADSGITVRAEDATDNFSAVDVISMPPLSSRIDCSTAGALASLG
jgi:hypothetical protein